MDVKISVSRAEPGPEKPLLAGHLLSDQTLLFITVLFKISRCACLQNDCAAHIRYGGPADQPVRLRAQRGAKKHRFVAAPQIACKTVAYNCQIPNLYPVL